MSCTSPKTVASTILPLVTPSLRSRNCSRCETAFFITSADCRTNGRINSPEPNLSPTSFIAGNRISLRTSTGPRSRSCQVDLGLDPVLAPPQDRIVDPPLGRRVDVVLLRGGGRARRALRRLPALDQPRERRRAGGRRPDRRRVRDRPRRARRRADFLRIDERHVEARRPRSGAVPPSSTRRARPASTRTRGSTRRATSTRPAARL